MERDTNITRRNLDNNRRGRDCAAPHAKHRGILFIKQCAVVVLIIVLYALINRSGLRFGKNCLSALGRAIRWEVDFGAIKAAASAALNNIAAFFSDVF